MNDEQEYEYIEIRVPRLEGRTYCKESALTHESSEREGIVMINLKTKPIKWRAEPGKHYIYVNDIGFVDYTEESLTNSDDRRYEPGNYFKTAEEAKQSKFYKVFHGDES